jgi:hypothetical protein
MNKNILITCLSLILLTIVRKIDEPPGVLMFGLFTLVQIVLTSLFVVGCVRLSGPSLRRVEITAKEPGKLIWGGVAALIASIFWFLVSAVFLFGGSSPFGMTVSASALLMILPALFLAGTGLSMIIYGIMLRYIRSVLDE